MKKSFLYLMTLLSFSLFAEENPQEVDAAKISEAFGHIIGKNLDTLGMDFDVECVIRGLQDSLNGKESPMEEMECIQAITTAQETKFKKQASENLKKAEDFLKENEAKKGIVSLEQGKVQYKITQKGKGASVKESASPLIKYTGKYIDGAVFGASKEAESLSLDETIKGFTKGLVGMREGEKRTLYIHPDFGYGTSGYLPPNSLLTFDIEVVKADTDVQPESNSAQ